MLATSWCLAKATEKKEREERERQQAKQREEQVEKASRKEAIDRMIEENKKRMDRLSERERGR